MPNSNPTIERMMMIFEALESRGDSLSQADLVQQTGLARSTVYRMLNSLSECGMLREDVSGRFTFGGKILRLAEHVAAGSDFTAQIRFLQPILDKSAFEIGETCKISIFDRGAIIVVAGALARTPHAMSYSIGEYLPLHAGGASKVLLASLKVDERVRLLGHQRLALTARTITDELEFEQEMERVAKQGWAEDRGEYSLNVCSFAAPIYDDADTVVAALSVPFAASTLDSEKNRIRRQTVDAARRLTEAYIKAPSRARS